MNLLCESILGIWLVIKQFAHSQNNGNHYQSQFMMQHLTSTPFILHSHLILCEWVVNWKPLECPEYRNTKRQRYSIYLCFKYRLSLPEFLSFTPAGSIRKECLAGVQPSNKEKFLKSYYIAVMFFQPIDSRYFREFLKAKIHFIFSSFLNFNYNSISQYAQCTPTHRLLFSTQLLSKGCHSRFLKQNVSLVYGKKVKSDFFLILLSLWNRYLNIQAALIICYGISLFVWTRVILLLK